MIKLTASLEHFLFDRYREKFALISLGHLEEMTDEMTEEYYEWLQTDDGKSYLEGGENYHEPR